MARSHVPSNPLAEGARALRRPTAFATFSMWVQSRSVAHMLCFVLSIASIQGAAYLVIAPPWQHYDEPTHFEYAWLIANQDTIPQHGNEDPALRREILNTLYATAFFRTMPAPPLLTDDGEVWLGVSELGHPPLYYALVSLPLRLVRHLDILSQLYVARAVSLLLFLGTIAIAFGLMRELLPWPHPLRWLMPLALALIPTYADVMTSVNSDVGAAFIGSVFLWGAVRLVRRGLHWRELLWTLSTATCGLFIKNTAAILLPLAIIAIILAVSERVRIARGYLALGTSIVFAIGVASFLTWGDATAWYRWSSGNAQSDATQVRLAAPIGNHALLLEVTDDATVRQLSNPVHVDQVVALRGKTLTLGGWLWSDRAGQQVQLGVRYSTSQQRAPVDVTIPITLTATPAFKTWTFTAPPQLTSLSFLLSAYDSPTASEQRVLLDGAVIAAGDFSTIAPPQFTDITAQSGMWGAKSFTNLLTNGSGEQSGPRVQPWMERTMYQYIHRSPAQVVAAIFDLDRVWRQIIIGLLPQAFDSFAGWFSWGSVRLNSLAWVIWSRCFALVVVLRAIIWFVQRRRQHAPVVTRMLLLLAVAAFFAWGNTLLRPLPMLGENDAIPIARYTFPAIIATCLILIGGLWVLVPPRFRYTVATAAVCGLLILNLTALTLIWQAFLYV